MTDSERYKSMRQAIGTQAQVAKLLGVNRVTIARRETGGNITREAWIAIESLPKLAPAIDGPENR